MAAQRTTKRFKPLAVTPADEFGFPFPAPSTDGTPRKAKHAVICPVCLDTTTAHVTLTKRGLATLYCGFCEVRIFAGDVRSHEMLRKWAITLMDQGVRQRLVERLAAL